MIHTGSIWRAKHKKSGIKVVVKATNKELHDKKVSIIDGNEHQVLENIMFETAILAHLTEDRLCPNSIIKFYDCFQSDVNYYVVMEDGGQSLFSMVLNVHKFIRYNKLDIDEWLKVCKIIFKQMIECIEYIHSKDIAHFDISLENWLINDIDIELIRDKNGNEKFRFYLEQSKIQCKICDFGLGL